MNARYPSSSARGMRPNVVAIWVVGLSLSAQLRAEDEPLLPRGLTIPVAAQAPEKAEPPPKTIPKARTDDDEAKPGKPRYIPRATPFADPDPGVVQAYELDWNSLVELARASGIAVKIADGKRLEAEAGVALAKSNWIPELRVGVSWLHHDGFIQDIPGNVINANKNSLYAGPLVRAKIDPAATSREVLSAQQLVRARQAQVKRACQTQFHDAAMAYIDLQSAQVGAAITLEAITLLDSIVARANEFSRVGLLAPLTVRGYQAAKAAQLLNLERIRQQHRAAGRRLADLLDLEGACLYAASENAPILVLAAIDRPVEELLADALANGPGVDEIASAQQALQEQLANAQRHRYTPSVALDLGYGAFGGGVGSGYNTWGDRFDAGAHVYWDVSELLRVGATRQVFESKKRDACLQQEKLRKSLTLGVHVSYDQALAARHRLAAAQQSIANNIDLYEKVRNAKIVPTKIKEDGDATGASQVVEQYGQEAKAIELLAAARNAYLEALTDWNKAQVMLHFLTGGCDASPGSAMGATLPPPESTARANGAPDNGVEKNEKPTDGKAGEPNARRGRQTEAQPVKGRVRGSGRPPKSHGPFPKLPVDGGGS